jgi:hypothetical protein
MVKSRNKTSMACNRPQKSWLRFKKRVVKACSGGREKIIHYGDNRYGHNYSSAARNSFRARHRCSSANNKLSARYWACKNLWSKGGSSKSCPRGRRCKGVSRRSRSPVRKSRTRRKSPRKSPRKSRRSYSPISKSRSRRRKSTRKSRSRRRNSTRKSRSRRRNSGRK